MNIRNSTYKNKEHTIVDVEIEHPQYGWIPYTFKSDEIDESYDAEIRVYLETITINTYIEPVSPSLTIKIIKQAVQNHLDIKAQELDYDNINTIAKFIGYDNPYRIESESLGLWSANVWTYIESELKKVQDELRELPTSVEAAILELPDYIGV